MPEIEYVWDELSDNVIEEYEDGVLSVSYDHEPGLYGNLLSQNRYGVTSYYHYDGRGDTVAFTNDAGNVTDTKEYDAWGNVVASSGSTVTPYQFGGQQGFQSGTAGVYVRARIYQPTVARWANAEIGLTKIGNRSRAAYSFDQPTSGQILHCVELLWATVASWKSLGMSCAADLLQASLENRSELCPDGCKESLNRIGFSYIAFCAEQGFTKKGQCGEQNQFRFKSKGSHKMNDPLKVGGIATNSGDVHFGLGKFEWSADGYCSWNCESNTTPFDAQGRMCCPCSGLCGFEIVVTDKYDYEAPPPKPPLFPDPLYCAKLLQSVGKLHPFNVRCSLGLHNRIRISGNRCDYCRPVLSAAKADDGMDRPVYDPSSGEGTCPGTAYGNDGTIIFRNPRQVYE